MPTGDLSTRDIERAFERLGCFAAAVDDLREQDKRRGGDGKLRDVEVSLADDHRKLLLYSDWSDDAATLVSSLMLPEPVAEEDFDSAFYVELIES